MPERLDSLGDRDELFQRLAREIEEFLLKLEENPDALASYVDNRIEFLTHNEISNVLSDQAKALLLESDYSVILEVMKYRESTAIRWICIWII
jgi:hypothetical protein